MPRISPRTYAPLNNASSGYVADEEDGSVKYYNSVVSEDGPTSEYTDIDDVSNNLKGPLQLFYTSLFVFAATILMITLYSGGIKSNIISRIIPARSGKQILDDDTTLAYFPYAMRRQGYPTLMCFDPTSGNIFKYKFLEKFNGVFEPHVTNQLSVYDPLYDEEKNYLKYTVCPSGNTADSTTCLEGSYHTEDANPGVFVECDPYDEFVVTMNKYDSSNDTIVDSMTGSFVCIYVRRELRALTKEDRDKTMDAMATLWWTPEDEGQAKYGENYHAATFLLE
jgi:hypothetical protein